MRLFIICWVMVFNAMLIMAQPVIRVNQLGYLPTDIKVAVLGSSTPIREEKFTLKSALNDEIVWQGKISKEEGKYGPFTCTYRLDFSMFNGQGFYYIEADGIVSPQFPISDGSYQNAADFILNYMRQQQCGYNPFLKDSCHKHDGFIIYHPTLDSTHIDVRGGWHDASDYLQYVTTSANAVYQMLFAYRHFPEVFGDSYDKDGNQGENGIPDILDCAKWGLDWLDRMNPEPGTMFNQIADDRDHQMFRLPTEDSVNYGKGMERPVYTCTGQPQGVFQHKNRATGTASTAGKYASAFALGSVLLQPWYPEYCAKIRHKAFAAYSYGKAHPGVCQTAPCRAPYFYEEDNWVDDMELAAIQLFQISNDSGYLTDAREFGLQEPTTPWMGADTARHYQWYPFLNLGHAELAQLSQKEFVGYLKCGLEKISQKGKNAFRFGIPFIWCSNNLAAAAITQCHLYRAITGDNQFLEMETALRDWLFGCNPWGTSMIVGLPVWGDTPVDPHSAFTHVYGYPVNGGLIDGPVYTTIFNSLKGVKLGQEDSYASFQSSLAVYHDDWGDYSTNEPTMDGTASLSYYLAAMSSQPAKNLKNFVYQDGAVIRTDTTLKNIHLVFTGGDFADGGEIILNTLKKHTIRAAFFLTGDFYRNKYFQKIIRRIKKEGHYLGAHSDKHLLYAPWSKRDSVLVRRIDFMEDLIANYKEMAQFGVKISQAAYFLPPYEWYNSTISQWTKSMGLQMVNFSPGTLSTHDWTYPKSKSKYRTNEEIYQSILDYETQSNCGLNGFILLTHIGAHPDRPDKFYLRLDEMLTELASRGYHFPLIGSDPIF